MVNAQEWLDKNYPKNLFLGIGKERKVIKKLDISNRKLEGELDLKDFENLEYLNCYNNDLISLSISNCPNLIELNCSNNELVNLDISKNGKLIRLSCEGNPSLTSLDVTKNTNLALLHCIDCPLTDLDISKNTKLESLGYNLLESNEKARVIINNIKEDVFFGDFEVGNAFGDYSNVGTRENENILEAELEPKNQNSKVMIASTIPSWFITRKTESKMPLSWFMTWFGGWLAGALPKDQCLLTSLIEIRRSSQLEKDKKRNYLRRVRINYFWENHVGENYTEKEITYDKIYPESSFLLKINKEKPLLSKELPIKLYNIEKDEVEWTKDNLGIKNYAILSYVWGQPGVVSNIGIWNTQYKDKLNPSGYKALHKAVKSCQLLGIDYLWIDQLCIDQNNVNEKNQEVPKMRQYYSNADATLIAMHTNSIRSNNLINGKIPNLLSIMEIIIKSEWFNRSWTFQEGWLSKQTIFMFDDKLIDGRILAGVWVLKQSPDTNSAKYNNLGEFSTGLRKFATPLGWTYYKDGYSSKDEVSLSLNQALQTIRKRNRTLPVDGIYSILGLLPYGEQVKPKYKAWGEQYTKEEVREALLEVMRIAAKEGYGEPLCWQGKGSGWMPEIIDEKGSTSVKRGLSAKCEPESITFKDDNIEVTGSKCIIKSVIDDWIPRMDVAQGIYDNPFTYLKTVNIELINDYGKVIWKKVTLWLDLLDATNNDQLILEPNIEKNDILFIPDKEKWESDISFALLLSKKNDQSYYRKGLVGLHGESEELLNETKKEKIMILGTIQQIEHQPQSQIQIPPK